MIRLLSYPLLLVAFLPTVTTSEADLESKSILDSNLQEKFFIQKIPTQFNINDLYKKENNNICIAENKVIEDTSVKLLSSGNTNTGTILDNSGVLINTGTIVDKIETKEILKSDTLEKENDSIEEKKVDIIKKKDYTDEGLMKLICKTGKLHGRITPLCDNWDLFYKLKEISQNKGVPFELPLGISLRESHLGTNFKSTQDGADDYVCSNTNNWAGLKKKVDNNGLGLKTFIDSSGVEQKVSYPDSNGCWLYPFSSIEDFWESLNNTLKYGYINKGLNTPYKIAPKYTGKTENTEDWVATVGIFF